MPYNTINLNGNSNNISNSPSSIHSGFNGKIYQSSIEAGQRPARNLNSAAYMDNKNN